MTARRHVAIAAVVIAVSHVVADQAIASSCSGERRPPCQAAWNADVVFAGTVRSIDVIKEETAGGTRILETVVRFDVDRPFINAAAGPVEIVSEGLSTCAYRFVAGQKYVVYAWKLDDGRLSTGICSRTRPLAEAAEDLEYLASAPPRASAGARVYGRVNEYVQHPADRGTVDYGPAENIVVTISSAAFSRDVVTGRDGRYELTGVPPGMISISVVTPFGFAPQSVSDIEIKDARACVKADFGLHAQASASGFVVDATGRPVAGVSVEAVAAELAGYQPEPFHYPARTDDRGRFSFERLPPGAYVFGVNLTKNLNRAPAEPQVFLPGTTAARDAAVVELKAGDKTELGTLRLTNR